MPESSVSYFSSSAFTCSGVMPTQSWGSGGREQVSTVSGSVAVSTEHVTAAGATAAGSEESPRSRRQGPCSSGGTSAARGRAASQGRGEAHLVAEGIEFVHVELTVAVGVVLAEDLCEHLALVAAPLEERVEYSRLELRELLSSRRAHAWPARLAPRGAGLRLALLLTKGTPPHWRESAVQNASSVGTPPSFAS